MNMFTIRGDECKRFDLEISGCRWSEIAHRLLESGIGTALGFLPKDSDTVYCNPGPDVAVDARALFVLVREEYHVTDDQLRTAVSVS